MIVDDDSFEHLPPQRLQNIFSDNVLHLLSRYVAIRCTDTKYFLTICSRDEFEYLVRDKTNKRGYYFWGSSDGEYYLSTPMNIISLFFSVLFPREEKQARHAHVSEDYR